MWPFALKKPNSPESVDYERLGRPTQKSIIPSRVSKREASGSREFPLEIKIIMMTEGHIRLKKP
jgi:hypothetical protein